MAHLGTLVKERGVDSREMSRLRGWPENQRGDNGGMRWWEGGGGEKKAQNSRGLSPTHRFNQDDVCERAGTNGLRVGELRTGLL